ncbi:hypothetical protein LTR67_011270 [Exophiala xenobiotica]
MASRLLNHTTAITQFEFDIKDFMELGRALGSLIVPSDDSTTIFKEHLMLIRNYAGNFSLPRWTLNNAETLATGLRDLIVVLTEPTNTADIMPFEQMATASRTLCSLDIALRWASQGRRNIQNTIILDGRILRSRYFQGRETRAERQHRDNQGFQLIADIHKLVKPEVVLVCNCDQFETSSLLMADLLVSSVSEAGLVETHTWPSGTKGRVMKSFHPEFVAKCEQLEQRTLRESLFKLTVVMAMNLLLRRQIRGPGIKKLRTAVLVGAQGGRAKRS